MATASRFRLAASDEFLNLVGMIYGTASDPASMPAVLRRLNELLGGSCAQVFTFSRGDGTVLRSQIGETGSAFDETQRQYVTHWGASDPRTALLATFAPGKVLLCHEHFDANYVSASSFYQDFFIPRGLRWAMGGLFDTGGNTATVVADVRSPDAPPFEDWAARALRQLLPHFRKASLLGSQLNQQRSTQVDLLDMLKALPMPGLITDSAGRCIESNDALDASMEALSLFLSVGRLRFRDADHQRIWKTALCETHATAVGQTVSLTGKNGEQWQLHVIPMRSVLQSGDAFDKKVMLGLFEHQAVTVPQPALPSIGSISRLTPAESAVLNSVLNGLPAKVIANRRGATVNTVRNQIVAILRKTGHNSQKELIAASRTSRFAPVS